MVNKKEIITKFINKFKMMSKDKLLNLHNNLLKFKKGGNFYYYPQAQQYIQPIRRILPKKTIERCKIIPVNYSTDYIRNDNILSAPRKYNLSLNMQTSIDAKRFYEIISLALQDYQDELSKNKYVCVTLKILSTSDNYYIFNVLLFLEHYLKKNKEDYTINKNEKYIILKRNNQEYIIKYKYDFFMSSIDIKIGKKRESNTTISKSKSSDNILAKKDKSQRTKSSSLSANKTESNRVSTGSKKLSSSFRFSNRSS